MQLQHQIALVTGAGRGLGRAFALALAQAGAHVTVTARSDDEIRDTVAVIERAGGAALAIPGDVTDRATVQQIVTTVEQQLGPVDILINNAGTLRAFGMIADIDPEAWWREIEVNLRGPFLYTHAVLASMIARRRGRILNIASGAGVAPAATISAYNVSKTALIRLTESIAIETKPYGIAVFAIHPGNVRTPMTEYVHASSDAQQHAPLVQHWFQNLFATHKDTPIEQATSLVMRLASGDADSLSGCFLSVDDDIDALLQQVDAIQREARLKLRLRT